MTNEVFRITWPSGGGDQRKVLVRIYGQGVEVFFDRADEVCTFECMSRLLCALTVCCCTTTQVRFVIMGNLFCSDYSIHRRFDLKGSSLGRSTDKPQTEIDQYTSLKDLDLNFIFRLKKQWFQEFQRQVDRDCDFLEQEKIMDYSLLVGVHFRDNKEKLLTEGSTDNDINEASTPRLSRENTDQFLADPNRWSKNKFGANMPARAEVTARKNDCESQLVGEPTGEYYDVILHFGVVCARDLPEEPSEEEFRLGLRNGIVLCNALNKVQPDAIPKVVEAPSDTAAPADGSALCAYQYFENLRNFLVAVEDLGLPTFEVSDLEKGGKGVRVVDCVLALKSFSASKKIGRQALCKYGGISKPLTSGKYFILKNSDAFMNKIMRSHTAEVIQNGFSVEQNIATDCSIESNEMTTADSLNMLVRTVLLDKKPEEVPLIVESLLNKVIQEYEHRIANQNLVTCIGDLRRTESFSRADTPLEPDHTSTSGSAAQQFQSEAEINFDLQQKQIHELRSTLSSVKSGMEQLRLQYSEEFSKIGKHLYILSNAASGYHKVLEENRKLYNQIQDIL